MHNNQYINYYEKIRFFADAQNDRGTRCVLTKCLPKHGMRIACADVRGCQGDEPEPFAFANLQTISR